MPLQLSWFNVTLRKFDVDIKSLLTDVINQESGILYFQQTTRRNKQNIKENTVQAYLVRQIKSNISS